MAYGTEKTFEIFWGEVVLELLVLLVLGSAGRCTCVRMYIRASQKESERERERERKMRERERERCSIERERCSVVLCGVCHSLANTHVVEMYF